MKKKPEEPRADSFPPDEMKWHGPPRPAGAYWVGGVDEGVAFTLKYKPAWWHRTMMRVAFGWEWIDEQPKL